MSHVRHYLLCARDRRRDVADGFRRHCARNAAQNLINAQNIDSIRAFATSTFSARRRFEPPRDVQAAPKWLRGGGLRARNRL
jgi:hypothetical protein